MPSDEQTAAASRRRELAAFLRAQRARLQPADVGLPPRPGQRRTPGLRREEVADLAGVGLTWYTWLEQARPIPASPQVVDAIARALRLDPDRHRHLRLLAELPVPPVQPPPVEIQPRLQRLVDAAAPSPAAVYDVHFDYLAWNRPYTRVRHDPAAFAPHRRNLPWILFTDAEVRARMRDWESAARAVLSQFRAAAGRNAADPRFTELVAELEDASPEFRQWWPDYAVREFRPVTILIDHPAAGRIALELFQLQMVEHPDLRFVVQVPVGAADLSRVGSLIASA
jgi:hypothetical protein